MVLIFRQYLRQSRQCLTFILFFGIVYFIRHAEQGGETMYKIAVITSEYSLHNILKIDGYMRKECKITYLPYSFPEHLQILYQENISDFDGLLFGGAHPYNLLLEHFGTIEKPAAFFTMTSQDYYRIVAKIAIRYPGIDFSRVYFDFVNLPLDYTAVFQEGHYPLTLDRAMDSLSWTTRHPAPEHYLKLWNSGKVDLIVTRYSSIEGFLSKHNIRHELLLPSVKSMKETFQGLLTRLASGRIQESVSCVGIVSLPKNHRTQENTALLLRRLNACNQRLGKLFLIYQHEDHIELNTSASALRTLTQEYSFCPVCSYLNRSLAFPVYIGWGFHKWIAEAHRNAERALTKATQESATTAYIATADNIFIGPLSSSGKYVQDNTDLSQVQDVPANIGISKAYLQQILAAAKESEETSFSAKSLSKILGLSTRNTSRILNTLVSGNYADVRNQYTAHQRGRPTKIYTIDFHKLTSE